MMSWHAAVNMWRETSPRHRRVAVGTIVAFALVAAIATDIGLRHRSPSPPSVTDALPWIYGNAHARYTLTEYTDLECPYCKAYFPVLKRWIDAHPDVNWAWHHRPLAMHEPAASREARLAECVGHVHGNEGFWQAVAWLYATTRSNGEGVPASASFPWSGSRMKACLANPANETTVEVQAQAADREGVTATPTIMLTDHQTGRSIRLEGVAEDDALLSAIDWLAASSASTAHASRHPP